MEGCCNSCSTSCNTKQEKTDIKLIILVISTIVYLFALCIDFGLIMEGTIDSYISLIFVFCYFALGYEILKEALIGLIKREFFNENSLMAIASIGAWIIGDGAEAVAILFFYRIGEALEGLIVEKSKKSIKNLNSLKIDNAKILVNEEIKQINPKDIKINDIVVVVAGDRIPADGIILQGSGDIDNSALNGESIPKNVQAGDKVLSGGINLNGILHIKATKNYEDSAFSKIIKLIEEGQAQKSKSEEFIRKFAKYYTPIVTILAICIVIFPSIYESIFLNAPFIESIKTWLYRGIIFLVVSCPCALVVSIPLTFFASLGRAGKEGILIKGSSYLETLNSIGAIVFDKTGTLTKGELKIKEIYQSSKYDKEFILKIAKSLELNSNHPIAKTLSQSPVETIKIESIKEVAGGGIQGIYENKAVAIGNPKFIGEITQSTLEINMDFKCQIFVSMDKEIIGSIILEDEIKKEAKNAISNLSKYELHMLSGDRKEVAKEVAKEVGINNIQAELMPEDKVNILKKIISSQNSNNKKTIFVGDGINDAPSLALSDVGIAMGKTGSDVALEGADVVILNDDLRKIPQLLNIAQKTRTILWQNIALALGVKGAIMVFGAFGITSIWIALFGDVGVAVLALLNAIRAIR